MRNKHNVSGTVWDRWGIVSQGLFNRLYPEICRNQQLYIHPETSEVPKEQWKTAAWNLAWTAADDTHKVLEQIADGQEDSL